jgi:hypothetical protein
MKFTNTDKIIAYLALISGLSISAVAVYYSVAGLVSIFSAAIVPIVVMGVALEVSKLIATLWLKLNWNRAPIFIKAYMTIAVGILMIITSMGIFGFLSKAHSDQSLVSGDVQSKIAVYDEKIKVAKDNIDANRRALKQMDEAVDQVMGRSQDEKGADKAVAIRKGQAKERARLLSDIATEQKTITKLSEERAPIAAEVRKVEAEVGPIKYIAAFVYGDNPDANVLEKAVTWVIIIIVSVFDPLAVILLLASQYSFQWFRKQDEEGRSPLSSSESLPATVAPPVPEEEKVVWEGIDHSRLSSDSDEEVDEEPKYEIYAGNPDDFKDPWTEQEKADLVKAMETFLDNNKEQSNAVPEEELEFLAEFTDKYPASDTDIEELSTAKDEARGKVVEEAVTITDEPVFKEAVEAGIYNQDGTLVQPVETEILAIGIDEVERPGDYITPPGDFAPPGTPGEQWAVTSEPVKSEQQADSNLDKIYKASSEELAKKHRSRGWFHAVFPKKDNQ